MTNPTVTQTVTATPEPDNNATPTTRTCRRVNSTRPRHPQTPLDKQRGIALCGAVAARLVLCVGTPERAVCIGGIGREPDGRPSIRDGLRGTVAAMLAAVGAAGATSGGTIEHSVTSIEKDIQAWKLAQVGPGAFSSPQAGAKCDLLARDASKALRYSRPGGWSKRAWSSYRRGLAKIAEGGVECSSGAAAADQARFVQGGMAIAAGSQLLVSALPSPPGRRNGGG